ncbi:PREDICTED: outer dense fiber protein 3-like [Nicrophorus vespilloides]|uniref:Outer dense fiber protein 3-like n=1 Tax=Nicrophorus vespilloides TaxID=110193 RepID=A0ABM1N2R7_NICVS|nr:PREDICTED: outer dense fiber protein 3-like [Nicrophorus vespilloides]
MARHGPGPGAYLLPPTVGYEKHDPSKYRNPQYSMGRQSGLGGKGIGPGPSYDIANMTRYGKATPPAYSLSSRRKDVSSGPATPGPGTYTLDPGKTYPAYTMAPRFPDLSRSATPAPNQYSQPSTLGPKVPHKPAAAAYSLSGNHGALAKNIGPGPAQYGGIPVDIYRLKPPKFSMMGRHPDHAGAMNPGPAAYLPKMPKSCSGGYSFGNRTINNPYVTADDVVPCYKGTGNNV